MKRYFKLLLLFNLIALSTYLAITLPPLDYKEDIQAIHMEMINYTNDFYTDTYVAKVVGAVGSISHTFTGPSGLYDINVEYIDETDGESTYTFKVNKIVKGQWIENKNPTKDRSFIYTLERLVLYTGDRIEIEGTRHQYSSARLVGVSIDSRNSISFFPYIKYASMKISNEAQIPTIIFASSLVAANLLLFMVITRWKLRRNAVVATTNEMNPSNHVYNNFAAHTSIDEKTLLDSMLSYLEANFSDSNFSLQQMSDHFKLPSNQMSTYFKKHTGQTIGFHLTNLRMEKAKYFLNDPELSLQSVANLSGYYNLSSFIRRFKAEMGITPGEYRKKLMLDQDEE
jgi:AraC-like DNA-binding protein